VGLSAEGKELPVITRAEPYAPGTGRVPTEDMLIRWLQNGDMVEQVGHSKKMRGYMVMPVRIVEPPSSDGDPKQAMQGWVTRRLVDKTRETNVDGGAWFEEVNVHGDDNRADRRRSRRGQDAED